MNDPVDNIVWKQAKELTANHYNPNMVMNQELRLLEWSIMRSGWVQPIMVNPQGVIIDGFHRWKLSQESKPLKKKYKGKVPCVVLDVEDWQAMCMTIRMNRAKGSHSALRMSSIIKALIDEHDIEPDRLGREIGANRDEIDLLYQDSIFKQRNLKDYRYSKAWEPHEQR